MKNIIINSVLTVLLILGFSSHAALYKGLDDEGNVIYSDKPFNNSQQFVPDPLSVVDALKVKAKEDTIEEKIVEFKYTDFDIVSPENNQTLWNEANLSVTLKLKPDLNTAEDHNVWLLLNGKPVVKNSQNLVLQIGRPHRGAHQLQAQVRNKEGKIILRTRPILMHIKHSVVPKNATN